MKEYLEAMDAVTIQYMLVLIFLLLFTISIQLSKKHKDKKSNVSGS